MNLRKFIFLTIVLHEAIRFSPRGFFCSMPHFITLWEIEKSSAYLREKYQYIINMQITNMTSSLCRC